MSKLKVTPENTKVGDMTEVEFASKPNESSKLQEQNDVNNSMTSSGSRLPLTSEEGYNSCCKIVSQLILCVVLGFVFGWSLEKTRGKYNQLHVKFHSVKIHHHCFKLCATYYIQ